MEQGWRRFRLLLVFLTLWKHAIGYPSWNSQINPRNLRYHKAFSPRGSKSLSDASVTEKIPVDVNSNVLAVQSPSSSQCVSASGNFVSVSQTPSDTVSVSLTLPQNLSAGLSTPLQLQGSSSSNVQGMASQSAGGPGSYRQYDITYKDRTGPKAEGSGQLVPARGSGHFASVPVIGQYSNESLSSGSSDLQLGGISSQLPSQGSGASIFLGASNQQGSQSQFTSTSQDSSRSQSTAGSSQFVSVQGGSTSLGGLSSQSQSRSSQYSPMSSFPTLGSLSMPVSGPSSVKTSKLFSSGSRGGSSQLATSRLSGQAQGVSSHPVGLQSQGSPSRLAFGSPQYANPSTAAAHTTFNPYNQASAQSLRQSQIPHRWQPSATSFSQGSRTSSVVSQSRFSAPSKSLASGGRLGQSALASLYSSASMQSPQSGSSQFSKAAGSALSLSHSQAPQRWQPSGSLSSQGFQNTSTEVSHSSSPSQGAKFPVRFTPASGSGLGSQRHYASSAQSMAGGTVGASSHYISAQREVDSNIASLQPQVANGHYAPAPSLDVTVPVFSRVTSKGYSSLHSQTWQPTTSGRFYSRFPTSGAALTQTSFSPPSVQSSSRFSSVAGGTNRLLTQSRGSYTGSSQSLGIVGQYTPGFHAYAKFGTSSLGVSSQSASGQSSSSQYSPLSTTGASGQLASSSGHLSTQGESGSSVGSWLLSQGALAKEALGPRDTSVSGASQAPTVSSGIQASGEAAFQSGSSQASSSLSSSQALSSPVDSVTQSASGSSQLSPFGHPTSSMTQTSGSNVQAASEGVSSASSQAQTLSESAGFGASVESQEMSGGSTSVLSGSYESSFGQSAPVSKPSRGSLSGYYGVKG